MTQDIKIRIVGDASGVTPAVTQTEAALKRVDAAAAGAAAGGSRKLTDSIVAGGKAGAASLALTKQEALALNYTLSDIAASLASGASPLTILLQQGGQVKDSFGGIGPLFSKLGALITPARLAIGGVAAAVAAFAYAAYEGNQESKELAKSIQLTGNYAGITEGKFNALTKTIAAANGQTVGASREILQQVVATGEIGPRLLAPMAAVIGQFTRASGQSAEEAVKDFARMGDGVAKWAASHNRSLNFITAEQYAYIKRLEEQGKAEEAELVVLDALSKHLGTKLPENMGTLERAWKSLRDTASEAWDTMKGAGRASTVEDNIQSLTRQLENAKRTAADAPSVGPYGGRRPSGAGRVETIEEQLRLAKRSQLAQLDAAAAAAEDARTEKLRIGAVDYIAKIREESKGIALVTKELEKYRQQVALLKGTSNEVSPADQAAQEKAIRDRFRDKSGESDVAAIAKQELRGRLEGVAAFVDEEADLYRSRQEALRRSRATELTGDQEYLDGLRNANDLYLQSLADAAQAEEILLNQRRAKADPKERAEIDRQLIESAAKYGAAQRDAAQQVESAYLQMNEAAQRYARDLKLSNERTTVDLIQDGNVRAAELAKLDIEQQSKRVALLLEGTQARKDAEDELVRYVVLRNQQLTEQLKPEWQRMLESWQDTNRLMRESFDSFQTGWLKSGEEAWIEFAKTGKVNTKSLVDFVVTELARLTFRQSGAGEGWAGLGKLFAGLFNAAGNGNTGGGAGGIDYTVGTPQAGAAKGAAIGPGGWSAFAKGSAFSNSIVSSPTPFRFAKGGGVGRGLMGEAGPEAIMPLARGRGGVLGVMAQSGPPATIAPKFIVNTPAGVSVERQEERSGDGGPEMEVWLSLAERRFAKGIANGTGPGSRALRARGIATNNAILRRA